MYELATVPRVRARKLLQYTTQELWDKLEGDFVLIMDDGEVMTNERQVIYSSYIWEYHRLYPETPLSVKHHVASVIANQRAGTDTHLALITNVKDSVYDVYKHQAADRRDLIDHLAKLSYEVSNRMYNDLTYNCEEYVTSLDITDFLQITMSDKVRGAVAAMEPTEAGIAGVYGVIKAMIKDDPLLANNKVANAIRSKLSSEGQAMQCLGPRGFLTDIDSHLFKIPITRSYTEGLPDMYSAAIESRSAAKSLIFSTDPLQKSEYFSRRQQLICQNVRHLHLGDCGSTRYITWHVRDARMEGATKFASDLKTIAGKYYLDEATQTLKSIKENDFHLIGKTLKLRDPVAGCMHPDPVGVCEVCYGETSLAIPKNSNLGHIACVTMTADLGQLILSTKHFDGSSAVEGIVLKPQEKRFLTAQVNGNSYYLSPDLKGADVQLIIAASQAMGLTDVNHVDDVASLNISRVSEFDTIVMSVNTLKSQDIVPLTVNVNGRLSNMTHDLLQHIKNKGWTIVRDNKGGGTNYVIDMNGWDFNLPILVLPMRHFNMSDHQGEIADMLEATMKDMEHRSNVVHPGSMLIELHDLVNRRLSINLSILSIILYSSMIVSADEGDYSLPKPWTTAGVGVKQMLLTNRSLSATMSYERHRDTLINPASYTKINRMDHVFDAMVLPKILNANLGHYKH